MRKALLAFCLLFSPHAWAQSGYNYYTQFTVGSSNWQVNNQISTGTNGDGSGAIWSTNSAGGSVVSTMTPQGPSQFAYDAGFTVTVGSNNAGSLGTYMILLGATNNAYLGSTTAQGSFYAVQFSPTMTNGSCVVSVSVSKYVNGVSQTFGGGAQGPCQLQTTYHAVFTQNSYIIVYGNGAVNTDFAEICEFNDSSPIYGHAGFGALNNPAGSGSTSDLEIYPISATAPTAPTAVKIYAAPTRVGLSRLRIYRYKRAGRSRILVVPQQQLAGRNPRCRFHGLECPGQYFILLHSVGDGLRRQLRFGRTISCHHSMHLLSRSA